MQPAGAFALFALRLAGILSLDEASKDNDSLLEKPLSSSENQDFISLEKKTDKITEEALNIKDETETIVKNSLMENVENNFKDHIILKRRDQLADINLGALKKTLTVNNNSIKMTKCTISENCSNGSQKGQIENGAMLKKTSKGIADKKILENKLYLDFTAIPNKLQIMKDISIDDDTSSISPVSSTSIPYTTSSAKPFLELQARKDSFVSKDLDYYYYYEPGYTYAPPTLSSRSLVSPIHQKKFHQLEGKDYDININNLDKLKVEKELKNPFIGPTNKSKLASQNPVATSPDEITTKESNLDSQKVAIPYQPLLKAFENPYPYGPESFGEPNLAPNELPNSNEDRHYTVHTEKPTVLFHFDEPGYSPIPPTIMASPTRGPTPSDPWRCLSKCPQYELVDWTAEYDIRRYPDTAWVSTVVIAGNRILAELQGYIRGQDYFYGLNDKGMIINLSTPFITQIPYGRHPGVLSAVNDFAISLFVHEDYYKDIELPTPINNEVLVEKLEAKTVFVHGFEANVWDVTDEFLLRKAQHLMARLRSNGEAFLDRYYYLASYSRPELYRPVYYEMWVYATKFREPGVSIQQKMHSHEPEVNQLTLKTIKRLCRGVECPSFEVLRTFKYGIQKRRYYDAVFVSTVSGDCEFTTLSVWKGFMPLHLYKHGVNSHMEVIEATRPIALVKVTDTSEPETECPQNMTMSLYLPRKLHFNPPLTGYAAPTIIITPFNGVEVYAYTVGGYLLEPDRVRKELSDMKYRLTEFGVCFKDGEFYVAVYDFIARYHGRQNEIWIPAEHCKNSLLG